MKNLKDYAIVFFDGNCNLCNGSVQFILKRDSEEYFKFSPLNSQFSNDFFSNKKWDLKNSNSIILFDNNQFFTKSDAILLIFKNLNSPLKYIHYLIYIPKGIRDFMYDIIAKYRYVWFGKRNHCIIPTKENLHRFL